MLMQAVGFLAKALFALIFVRWLKPTAMSHLAMQGPMLIAVLQLVV